MTSPTIDECSDYAYWLESDEDYDVIDCTELEDTDGLSDCEEVELVGVKAGPTDDKFAFIKLKYKNVVRKIKLNLTGWNKNYLDKVIKQKNYKNLLNVIRVALRRESASLAMTPDGSLKDFDTMTREEQEEKRNEWQEQLVKVEEEIQILKKVLTAKLKEQSDLKRKLGITRWSELTGDISQGVKNVKESNVYQNVEGKIEQIGKVVSDTPIYQKTESVVKATAESTKSILGGLTGGFSQKLGQIKSSESFRSFEEKVGSAYENVRTKVTPSRSNSMQGFDDAVREEAARKANPGITPTSPSIPENLSTS